MSQADEGGVDGQLTGAIKDELVAAARAIKPRAYAPYSGFHVGSALLARSGARHLGVNVENASYPVGSCAERNAIGAAVTAGDADCIAVAVSTDADTPVMPCGMCAQALFELNPDLWVIAEDRHGNRREARIRDALPFAYQGEGLTRVDGGGPGKAR
ncbi:MAG TPA: cytidine deaminase [Myxococcota bacterium]|nr:cytidine deaminase [Myxococcota bacterium]